MFFRIFTALCTQHNYLILESFHHPHKKPQTYKQSIPIALFHEPLMTTNLHSISMDLSVLGILYKGDHTTCSLLWLAYLQESSMLSTCISISFLFYDWVIFLCMALPLLFNHSLVNGHLGCFHFLPITNNDTVNICAQVFVWTLCFQFPWIYT